MAFLSSEDSGHKSVGLTVTANVVANFKPCDAIKFKALVSSLDVGDDEVLTELKKKALSNLSPFNFSIKIMTKSLSIRSLYQDTLDSQETIMSSMVNSYKNIPAVVDKKNKADSLLKNVFCLLYCVDVIDPKKISSDFNALVKKHFENPDNQKPAN